MIAALSSRRLFPILAILTIVAIGQYYVIVHHGELITYMKNKLYACNTNPECLNQTASNAPLHILIVAYARTGSSFIGDLIQNYPGVFYHFEPLHFLSSDVLNDTDTNALSLLYKLFRCQVSSISNFLEWQKRKPAFMKLNRYDKYWEQCRKQDMCYNSTYMDASCSNHSIVLIKTIRMSLTLALRLLASNPDLNLKIIYLIRDPRGTFHSRSAYQIMKWCKGDIRCYDPKMFCARLKNDLKIASILSTFEEKNFMLLKFEDISLNPFRFSKYLFSFLGLKWIPEMETYLKSHTRNVNIASILKNSTLKRNYITYRNSADVATKWQQKLPFKKVIKIQQDCMHVLQRMQYPVFSNSIEPNISYNKYLKNI